MLNLDFYLFTDIYSVNHILRYGVNYDCYKTAGDFGFAVYLTDDTADRRLNFGNKTTTINVHLNGYADIFTVNSFQDIITAYPSLTSYLNAHGRNERLGGKIEAKLLADGYAGVYVRDEHTLALYTGKNIRYVKLNEKQ